jgi:hypothetical protein
MEKKIIEVCDAIHVDISCTHNDSVDIRAGGPAILGYDFYVSPDEDIKELKEFLKSCIKKYKRPLMGISTRKHKNFPVADLWDRNEIENCIKNNGIY